ncbi:MAG: DUF2029 domain-containing protein [Planctomycetes bacterium]|nr:DUF2029 domain-containing protein [Planctomycetota bacterium]
MSEILFQYVRVYPTTWVYLSSLLMIGLFFKFGRFWSMRNLDLVMLILLAPGLLLVESGREMQVTAQLNGDEAAPVEPPSAAAPDGVAVAMLEEDKPAAAANGAADAAAAPEFQEGRTLEKLGFLWLFGATGLVLIRLLLDPTMVRRPLLEPNLTIGGLTFIGCALFVFLMANVITSRATLEDLEGPRAADQLIHRRAVDNPELRPEYGPGLSIVYLLPNISTMTLSKVRTPSVAEQRISIYAIAAKAVAILSHLAVVLGMVLIGHWHFNNLKMGIGAAVLYLMLPYTAQMTGRVPHVLPAALLIWAVVCYRRPVWAGALIGLAVGVSYYPLFLLPLWSNFYWRRGVLRFAAGAAATLALVALSLVFVSADAAAYGEQLRWMFGLWPPQMENLDGVWGLGWDSWYRITVMAAFVTLALGMALWPAQKNLGTLLSCSAAIMAAVQFWHGYGGGLYMAWYLPLLLLTVVRPNLEDRVAVSVLGEGWFSRRQRPHFRHVDLAA